MSSCTVTELKAFMENDPHVFLVDCRTPQEYEWGHVPGAELITLGENLESYIWPKDRPVYVICHSGGRSAAFCWELKQLGVEAVNVEGGTSAWLEAGYEVER